MIDWLKLILVVIIMVMVEVEGLVDILRIFLGTFCMLRLS